MMVGLRFLSESVLMLSYHADFRKFRITFSKKQTTPILGEVAADVRRLARVVIRRQMDAHLASDAPPASVVTSAATAGEIRSSRRKEAG